MPASGSRAGPGATSTDRGPKGSAHRAAKSRPGIPGLDDSTLQDLAEVFQSLGHVTRLRLVYALFDAERCVGELAAALGMSESAVSHQLRLLRGLRLVRTRRAGKLVYYALDDDHVEQLIAAGVEHALE